MSLYQRQPFAERGEYVVTKSFRSGGRQFSPGDDFPWRRLACSARRLRQMYDARFIELKAGELETPDEEDLAEEVLEDESVEDESDDEAEDESEDESEDEEPEDEEPFIFDPEVHELITDSGKRYVCADGEKLFPISRKEAKRLKLLRKPGPVDQDEVLEE